MLLLVFDNSTA